MKGAKMLKEKKLLYAVKTKKDAQAFGQLYDLYIEKIYRFIFFKVRTKEEAEDITSEIFLKTWNYLTNGTSKKVQSFSGLIYTIARTSLADFYRKKKRTPEVRLSHEQHEIESNDSILDTLAKDQAVNQVFKSVKKMKKNYQEVVLLRYVEGLSTKEIASIIKKSATSTRVLLHRAVKLLKKITDEEERSNTN